LLFLSTCITAWANQPVKKINADRIVLAAGW
jgi:hypothetical protein